MPSTTTRAQVELVIALLLSTLIAVSRMPKAEAAVPFRFEYFALTDSNHRSSTGEYASFPWSYGPSNRGLLPSGAVLGTSAQLSSTSPHGYSSWIANKGQIIRLGILDDQHTDGEGRQQSTITAHAPGDRVTGQSIRLGVADGSGSSAWHYDGSQVRRIGLFNNPSLPQTPYAADWPQFINNSGQVVGVWENDIRPEEHYQSSAWFFDGATTRRIGLPAAITDHRNFDYESVVHLSDAGQVVGSKMRGPDGSDQIAWFFDGRETISLGLTDRLHTGLQNRHSSEPVSVTDDGLVTLHSDQYSDGDLDYGEPRGQTAWTYRGGVARHVGLKSLEFTGADGLTHSRIDFSIDGGIVVGSSRRSDYRGEAAWIDNGFATTEIPLPPIPHPNPNAISWSRALHLADDGRVYGNAGKWIGHEVQISLPWTHQDGVTRQLGLDGPEFHSETGEFESNVLYVLENGHATGYTYRFLGDQYGGRVPWIDDGSVSIPLELVKPRDDPSLVRSSDVIEVNRQGQALGVTHVRAGSPEYERRLWFYDPATGVNSVEMPNGVNPVIFGLTDSGWIYGHYYRGQNDDDEFIDPQAFVWHADAGFLDLVDYDGMGDRGVVQFDVGSGDAHGRFVGTALTSDGSYLTFLATIVPEPAAMTQFLTANLLLAMITRTRRQRPNR